MEIKPASEAYYTNINKNEELKQSALDYLRLEKDRSVNEPKIFRRLWRLFDLGSTKNLNMSDMNAEEAEIFFKSLAKLAKKGIIGWNYFEIDGQVEKHYITNQIGNNRLSVEDIRYNSDEYA